MFPSPCLIKPFPFSATAVKQEHSLRTVIHLIAAGSFQVPAGETAKEVFMDLLKRKLKDGMKGEAGWTGLDGGATGEIHQAQSQNTQKTAQQSIILLKTQNPELRKPEDRSKQSSELTKPKEPGWIRGKQAGESVWKRPRAQVR